MHLRWPSRLRCKQIVLDSGRLMRSLFGQDETVGTAGMVLNSGRSRRCLTLTQKHLACARTIANGLTPIRRSHLI